jgi:hypothetical protein
MSNIKNIGLLIRKSNNVWRIHYMHKTSSMGYVKDNPIILGNLKEFYLTRAEITHAVQNMGYLVHPINDRESILQIDFDDSETIARIEEALKS